MQLDVSNNLIEEISPAISLLAELRGIFFASAGRLSSELNLSGNHIARLPEEMGLMKDLNTLDLSANELTQYPAALCAMERFLRVLIGWFNLAELWIWI